MQNNSHTLLELILTIKLDNLNLALINGRNHAHARHLLILYKNIFNVKGVICGSILNVKERHLRSNVLSARNVRKMMKIMIEMF